MIRSSRHTLKFTNKDKQSIFNQILIDYQETVQMYVKFIISESLPLKLNLSSKDLPDIKFKHSQWKQIAYKDASGIVRSNLKKIKNTTFKKYKKIYTKCCKQNRRLKFIGTRYRDLNINYLKRMKFNIKSISINLDNRLWDSQIVDNEFDEFIRIKSPYFQESRKRSITFNVPIKYHKHSLKFKSWNRKNTIRLVKINGVNYLDFVYEKEQTCTKSKGKTIAFDSGYKKLLVDSNGNQYGSNLESIYKKIANKQRGSKKYQKTLEHKKNEINRTCNLIDFSDVNHVILENLKNVKKNSKGKLHRKLMNKLQYWSYKQVFEKLEKLSEIEGFYITYVNPAYTSQTCSKCGVIDKSNRSGEIYQCSSCGLLIDADYNAAINIHSRGVYNPSSKENLIL